MRFERVIGQRVLVLSNDELHALMRIAARGVVGAVLAGHIDGAPKDAVNYFANIYEELRMAAEASGLVRYGSAGDISRRALDFIRAGLVLPLPQREDPCAPKG